LQAIALIEAPGHVSARYRLQTFAPALARAGWSLALEPVPRGALERVKLFSRLRHFDAVLLQRQLLPFLEFRYLRAVARRLIYDFDDAMLYRDSYHPRGHSSVQRARRFSAVVRGADTVIAGNAFLKGCAIECGARPEKVAVVPTCVELEKYPPRAGRSRRDGFEMVWIGSSSTLAGLETQCALLQQLGREIPGLRLRLICDRFANFDPLPVIPVTWAQETEASALAQADFGISWMPDDVWSKGKCGLKVLQYGAAWIPTIANPVGVHREIIRDGITGLLPDTDEQWLAAVKTLARDPALRTAMGARAHLTVEQSYSVSARAADFVSIVTSAIKTT
jgi:glycosyltransferase involved in cell wall biosynthesis